MTEEKKEPAAPAGGYVGEKRGDHINVPRTELLAGISKYDQEDQDDLLWLHGYALDILAGSKSALIDYVGTDWTTIWRIWEGKYNADIAKFMERVRHLRRKAELSRDAGFVETVTTEKIFDTLSLAARENAIVHISGPSGRSKTHAVREWQRRNNHGRSVYIDCPVSGGVRGLLDAVAKSAGIGSSKPTSDLMNIVERAFDYRHTIVLDECQRLLPSQKSVNICSLEFIRRLHDTSRVGVAMVSTNVFRAEMRSGRLSSWFEQLLGRIEVPLAIPEKVSRLETVQICTAFCKDDPPSDLVNAARAVANSPGRVRLLFTLLRHAALLARSKKQSLGLAHFQIAQDFRNNINRWPED